MLRASLRNLFRGGAAVGALTIAIGTASAQAPQTPAAVPTTGAGAAAAKSEAEKKQTDIIVITGSRLRQENLDSPNPVVEIGAEEIENRQVFNVIDVVEDLPVMGIGTNNRGTQTQNGDSFAFPDVLDLGTQRTLTLLNGHRVVASNPGSIFVPGNASGSQVDLSVFNPAIIDRVDVLAGTGGAIYGADAVAGVVNLITKDKFEGLDFRASAGISDLGDGKQYRLGGNWGKSFMEGKAHVVLSGDYFHQDLIGATADRAVRYGGTGVTNPYEGSVRNTAAFSAQDSVATLLAGGAITTAFLPSASDGVRSSIFGPLSIQNPLITQGGSLLTGQLFGSGFTSQTILVPRTPISGAIARAAADPQGFAFFAPTSLPTGVSAANVINTLAPGTNVTGLSATQLSTLSVNLLQRNRPTPAEYFAKNPNLNPLLFAGTFGTNASGTANLTNGAFPTIANTDPATSAIFPRLAVPLKFDASGNLVPLNLGTIDPAMPVRLGQTFGGDGYDSTALGHTQLQAGTERIALAALGS